MPGSASKTASARGSNATKARRDRSAASGPVATPPPKGLADDAPAASEPDRATDDWGRSELAERLFDRTLVEFLYRYWFRCEAEGLDNVPSGGGALLVANHAGAFPPDAMMIAKALRDEHPRQRQLYVTVEHFFKGYPGLAMLLPKLGHVPAHPANVHRLLADERQLVLMFPEGRKATEKLFKDRYQLRRFGQGGFVSSAIQAHAPIVPVCVVGAEESAPTFAHIPLWRRLTGLLYFPITPTFPHFGPIGMASYLPAKFKIRFLEPIQVDEPSAGFDRGLVQTLSQEVRARIQRNLFEMVQTRRSVWFG